MRAQDRGRLAENLPAHGASPRFCAVFRMAKVTHTRPLFTRYALSTIASNEHFSHDKAARELGYRPRDMRETIADTIAFLRGGDVPLELTGAEGGIAQ